MKKSGLWDMFGMNIDLIEWNNGKKHFVFGCEIEGHLSSSGFDIQIRNIKSIEITNNGKQYNNSKEIEIILKDKSEIDLGYDPVENQISFNVSL